MPNTIPLKMAFDWKVVFFVLSNSVNVNTPQHAAAKKVCMENNPTLSGLAMLLLMYKIAKSNKPADRNTNQGR